ncbi:MAG: helix-turn-helix transcriptional regulator [Alphaproteobacteria bacterium]|nr:helix-turn-helix transcriptional regulator [Alphaproteobacteria bacterium]
MTSYGQFCAIARAHEILGGRWTILIARELLCGSRRFNDILRGLPRISRTVLSERLQALIHAGAVMREEGPSGPQYRLTEAGQELSEVMTALAVWGQRRLPRDTAREDLDIEPVLVDMARRVRFDQLPAHPVIVRFELAKTRTRFLLLRKTESALCLRNVGFPEPVRVVGPLSALAAWWRGDVSFAGAQNQGLAIEGTRDFRRAFPDWFERYAFAQILPAPRAPEPRRAPIRPRTHARKAGARSA